MTQPDPFEFELSGNHFGFAGQLTSISRTPQHTLDASGQAMAKLVAELDAQCAALSEGHCPVHPRERLTPGSVTQWGRVIEGGVCPIDGPGSVFNLDKRNRGWQQSYQAD